MKKNRAFLKWAGGKYSLIDDIRRYLPEGKCLIEPFVGAGSVFLNTDYDRYILSDINGDLINLYSVVQDRTQEFIVDAAAFFTFKENNASAYYAHRQEFNKSTDTYRRALLFLYLNRHCYNGLCRYNLKGEFNVPFGCHKKPYFPEKELYFFAEKAKKAVFLCRSYDRIMSDLQPGSIVYCDPPYAPLSATANFTAYHTNNFNLHQQAHLAEVAVKLAQEKNIPVLISNHDTATTRIWYREAKLHVVNGRRSICRNGQGRVKVDELLALYSQGEGEKKR